MNQLQFSTGKKILLVDDSEVHNLKFAKVCNDAGFEAVVAKSGQQAMDLARRSPDFDAVVTDLNLPDGDGMHVCKEIRAMSAYKSVPIILLTIESSPDVKQDARLVGIDLHLTKPVEGQKFLNCLKKLLKMI